MRIWIAGDFARGGCNPEEVGCDDLGNSSRRVAIKSIFVIDFRVREVGRSGIGDGAGLCEGDDCERFKCERRDDDDAGCDWERVGRTGAGGNGANEGPGKRGGNGPIIRYEV